MKTSVLIKKLIDHLANHGDLPVYMSIVRGRFSLEEKLVNSPKFITGKVEEESGDAVAIDERCPDRVVITI